MWLKTSLGIILVFVISLQGCGRKGPLNLPDAQKVATPTTAQGE